MYRTFIAGFLLTGISLMSTISYAEVIFDRAHQTTYVEATVLADRIKAGLAAEQLSSATEINIQTDSTGNVAVTGTAVTDEDAAKAVAVARATEGVESVTSEIIVRRTH
jgi:osmotically-inducible protein OsmY